jgi:osmotically inducible lipoprotein OsmB
VAASFQYPVRNKSKGVLEMKSGAVALVVALALATGGCSNMNSTEQRVLSGGAIGAGTGAAVGALTGLSIGTGALIGAGVGAATGYIVDQSKK